MEENEREDGEKLRRSSTSDGASLEFDKAKHPCAGCWHWRGDFYKTCNYIFDMGRKRPCEPGKECTERSDITEAGIFHPWREID
jgi:hypothetical protein